jgi:DNA-binding response OmpR family regulator
MPYLIFPQMRRPRILIVDDEPGLVRVMTMMLTHLNRYEVRSVTDATQALEAAVKFKPDLVLLDWIMPHLCGGDVAQQIRSESRVTNTPILFLSAIIAKQNEIGELAGFPAVAKPIGVHELVAAIEAQLTKPN